MGNCCTTSKEEIVNEVKKETKPSEYETKGTDDHNQYATVNQSMIQEQIVFEVKDNPLEDFSKAIFLKLNEMRTNPIVFYNKSSQYYLNEFISKAVGQRKRPSILSWSTQKARKISDYFQSKANRSKSDQQRIMEINEAFEQDFTVFGYVSKGAVSSVENIIWTLLSSGSDNDKKRIFCNDYAYCVIYSDVLMNEDVASFFFLFQEK